MKRNRYAFLSVATALTIAFAMVPPAALMGRAVPGFGLLAEASAQTPPAFREITWEVLIPKGWDPMQKFKSQNLTGIYDNSDKAIQMMDEMREAWDNAPTVAAMDGVRVRLPGYIVPLDGSTSELRDFLLVPYFGACIHLPPPPANQIVHVQAAKPVKGFSMANPVWVHGTLKAVRHKSGMGTSGYQMELAGMEPYVEKRR